MQQPIEIIAYTIRQAVVATGISRAALYQDIKAGLLETRKRRSTTLIEAGELRRYINDLPTGAE